MFNNIQRNILTANVISNLRLIAGDAFCFNSDTYNDVIFSDEKNTEQAFIVDHYHAISSRVKFDLANNKYDDLTNRELVKMFVTKIYSEIWQANLDSFNNSL